MWTIITIFYTLGNMGISSKKTLLSGWSSKHSKTWRSTNNCKPTINLWLAHSASIQQNEMHESNQQEQLTMSKTRFGSRSKWPINDCRSCINEKMLKCNKNMGQSWIVSNNMQAQVKTLMMPIVAADVFSAVSSEPRQRRVTCRST